MSVKLKESELQQLQSYLDRLEQNVHYLKVPPNESLNTDAGSASAG